MLLAHESPSGRRSGTRRALRQLAPLLVPTQQCGGTRVPRHASSSHVHEAIACAHHSSSHSQPVRNRILRRLRSPDVNGDCAQRLTCSRRFMSDFCATRVMECHHPQQSTNRTTIHTTSPTFIVFL